MAVTGLFPPPHPRHGAHLVRGARTFFTDGGAGEREERVFQCVFTGLPLELSGAPLSDNAAMVGFAGLVRFRAGRLGEGFDAVARSRWPMESLE